MDPDCESHRLSNVSLDFLFFDPALVCYLICRHFKIAVSPAQTAKFDKSSSNTFAGKDQLLEAQQASPLIPLHREFRSFAFVQQSDCMPCRWKVALPGSLDVILASPMVLRKAWQRKVGQPSLPLLNQGRINGQRPGKPLETVQDPCSLQGGSQKSFVDSPMPTDCVNLNLQVAFQAIVVRSEFVFCFTASTLQPQLTPAQATFPAGQISRLRLELASFVWQELQNFTALSVAHAGCWLPIAGTAAVSNRARADSLQPSASRGGRFPAMSLATSDSPSHIWFSSARDRDSELRPVQAKITAGQIYRRPCLELVSFLWQEMLNSFTALSGAHAECLVSIAGTAPVSTLARADSLQPSAPRSGCFNGMCLPSLDSTSHAWFSSARDRDSESRIACAKFPAGQIYRRPRLELVSFLWQEMLHSFTTLSVAHAGCWLPIAGTAAVSNRAKTHAMQPSPSRSERFPAMSLAISDSTSGVQSGERRSRLCHECRGLLAKLSPRRVGNAWHRRPPSFGLSPLRGIRQLSVRILSSIRVRGSALKSPLSALSCSFPGVRLARSDCRARKPPFPGHAKLLEGFRRALCLELVSLRSQVLRLPASKYPRLSSAALSLAALSLAPTKCFLGIDPPILSFLKSTSGVLTTMPEFRVAGVSGWVRSFVCRRPCLEFVSQEPSLLVLFVALAHWTQEPDSGKASAWPSQSPSHSALCGDTPVGAVLSHKLCGLETGPSLLLRPLCRSSGMGFSPCRRRRLKKRQGLTIWSGWGVKSNLRSLRKVLPT